MKHLALAVVWFLVGTFGARVFLSCGGSEFTEDEQGGAPGAPGAPEQGGALGKGGAAGAPEQGGALGQGGALELEQGGAIGQGGAPDIDARCSVGSPCQDSELAAARANQLSSCENSCAEPESAGCPFEECEAIKDLPMLPCSVACLDCRDECSSTYSVCNEACGVAGDAFACRQTCQTSYQACQTSCQP